MEVIARVAMAIVAIVALADMTSEENKKYFDSDFEKAAMFLLGVLILMCIVS